MYKLTLALGLVSSALVASQSTTTLFLLGFGDSQEIDASIIGSDSTATTFSLTCAATISSTDCGVPDSFTFTQGPSTAHYEQTLGGEYGAAATADLACSVTSDHGVCTISVWGGISTAETDETTTVAFSNYGIALGAQAVTIVDAFGAAPGATGGSNTIASTSATTTSGAAGTTTSSGSTPTGSSSGSSSVSSTGSSSGKPSGSSSVSTGGMPMITGRAQWVIGGAAAAVAIAAM